MGFKKHTQGIPISKDHSKAMARNITLLNKKKYPDGYIYVVQFGSNDLFKFGVSQNPDRRIKDIDSYSPVKIREIGRYYFKNVYETEEMIHDNLKDSIVRREWFKLEKESVLDICKELKQMSDEGVYLIRI